MSISGVGNESDASLVQTDAKETDNILDELDGSCMIILSYTS